MKRTLQILALVLVLVSASLWLARGANRGWTKTSIAVKTVDEVTGIEGIAYQSRFVPGLDFLAGALVGGAALAGLSCLFRKPKTSSTR